MVINEGVDPSGTIWVGGLALRFVLQYEGEPLMVETIRAYRADKGLPDLSPDPMSSMALGEGLTESDRALIGARFVSQLEEELASVGGPLRARVAPKFPNISIEGSGKTVCGPGVPDVVTLYGVAYTGAEQLAVWATLMVGLAEIIKRLRDRTGQPVLLDTGSAVIVAAEAIQKQTGEHDLALAFSTEMTAGAESRGWRPIDGYAVGFRNDSSVRIALMDPSGEDVVVRLLPLPSRSRSR